MNTQNGPPQGAPARLYRSRCSSIAEQKPQPETVEFGFRARMTFPLDHAPIPMQAVVIAACKGPHKSDSGRQGRLIASGCEKYSDRQVLVGFGKLFFLFDDEMIR